MAQDEQNREVSTLRKVFSFFSLLVFILLVYAGFKFGMPYYRYTAFKSDVKEIIKISVEGANLTEQLSNQVYERAKELKIPIEKKDIKVTVGEKEKTITIKTSWSEEVDIVGIYQRTLQFTIDIR